MDGFVWVGVGGGVYTCSSLQYFTHTPFGCSGTKVHMDPPLTILPEAKVSGNPTRLPKYPAQPSESLRTPPLPLQPTPFQSKLPLALPHQTHHRNPTCCRLPPLHPSRRARRIALTSIHFHPFVATAVPILSPVCFDTIADNNGLDTTQINPSLLVFLFRRLLFPAIA